jgi:hypothetical protein
MVLSFECICWHREADVSQRWRYTIAILCVLIGNYVVSALVVVSISTLSVISLPGAVGNLRLWVQFSFYTYGRELEVVIDNLQACIARPRFYIIISREHGLVKVVRDHHLG